MLQAHTCVSVHCDQCGHILGRLAGARHFRTDSAAINAATTDGWRITPDGQWWCPICAPALICRAEQRHQFTPWRRPQLRGERLAPSEYGTAAGAACCKTVPLRTRTVGTGVRSDESHPV
jgi:hypothetical protein